MSSYGCRMRIAFMKLESGFLLCPVDLKMGLGGGAVGLIIQLGRNGWKAPR